MFWNSHKVVIPFAKMNNCFNASNFCNVTNMPTVLKFKPYSEGMIITPERIAILEALLTIPTAKLMDLSKKTGLHSGSIRTAIVKEKTLIWSGLVEKTDYGSYRIVASKRAAIEHLIAAWYELFPKAAEKRRSS